LDVILPNDGAPKLVRGLTYPATAKKKVDTIFTDLTVIAVTPEGMVLREVFPGLTPDDIHSVTEPRLIVSPDLREMGP
jgi:acyl CoA:acetate/3-ketoacid CoA transferase beta subunit